jgi:hypothetical protein
MSSRLKHSCLLQIVCEYVDDQTNLKTIQFVNKRFYLKFVAATVPPIRVFTRRGFKIQENSAFVEIFRGFKWEELLVKQVGENI